MTLDLHPSLVKAICYRFLANTSNDDDTRYRARGEVEEWRRRDPLELARRKLAAGVADTLDEEARARARYAAEWAESQPDGEPASVMDHIYAAQQDREAVGRSHA
jgi:TPP-dependent pyruvate/acetoin dehydrogenase alpha subunit